MNRRDFFARLSAVAVAPVASKYLGAIPITNPAIVAAPVAVAKAIEPVFGTVMAALPIMNSCSPYVWSGSQLVLPKGFRK